MAIVFGFRANIDSSEFNVRSSILLFEKQTAMHLAWRFTTHSLHPPPDQLLLPQPARLCASPTPLLCTVPFSCVLRRNQELHSTQTKPLVRPYSAGPPFRTHGSGWDIGPTSPLPRLCLFAPGSPLGLHLLMRPVAPIFFLMLLLFVRRQLCSSAPALLLGLCFNWNYIPLAPLSSHCFPF